MKIKNYLIILLTFGGSMMLDSCNDYLDVSDELAAELTMKETFDKPDYCRRFHRYIYSGMLNPDLLMLDETYSGLTGLDNPWPSVSDEIKDAQWTTANLAVNGYNSSSAQLHRWRLYKQIRQANEFIKYAHVIPAAGQTSDYIGEDEMSKLKNEARFLRAYYHYLLFELYGPIPIMDEAADQSSADLDYYRAPIDDVIKYIDTELNACLPLLPEKEVNLDGSTNTNRNAAPTKGAALAILAKLHMLAASPLYNGGYTEALALKDAEGKQLFPAEDKTKWNTAVKALETFLDYAKTHYHLFKVYKNGKLDPAESLYQLYQTSSDNPEAIWQSSKNAWGNIGQWGEGRERRCTPRDIYGGNPCIGVLQEMIDDFEMSDGLSIKESPLYKEDGIGPDNIPNMYLNREPRFYQDITYSGKHWQIIGTQIYFYKGTANDNSKGDNCYTGTLLYKGMCRDLLNSGQYSRGQYRAGIIFRLADFYLLYAEALNHTNPGDPRIIQYVDSVRERAGVPLLKVIKPNIIGNQALQEKAIRHERRVELFVEGQRYFDIRRWMCNDDAADNEFNVSGFNQGGPAHGMNMNGANLSDFMKRTVFENRVFEKRMLLYPIPQDEINKSRKLIQNPGW